MNKAVAKEKPKARRKVKAGALFMISALLFGSALVRLGLEAGPAIAREAAATFQPNTGHPADPDHPADSPELGEFLAALQKREAALRLRETQIEDRMKALEIADAAIEEKMAALVEIEAALSSTLALADGASEDDLARLTSVYEKMKPKESAALFEEMEPRFAAGFLSRMRPDAAAGIMARLSPQAAYTISVVLAGRNATVPKN